MQIRLLLLAPFALAALLMGCTIGTLYPRLDVSGAAASQLTLDDIRELRQLVQARPDILKPLDRIEMQRADEAHITSGSNTWDDKHPRSTSFIARKKNGRWYIVPGTVDTREVIITG